MPTTGYYIQSTTLSRGVIITDKAAAEQFAKEQTEHTSVQHTALPIEIHQDAGDLNLRIDKAVRETTEAAYNPAQRRAFAAKPASASGKVANEEQS